MSIDRKLLPARCRDCAKLNASDVYGKCAICINPGFQEKVLCDLNRRIQDEPRFECYAFQPALKLVGASGKHVDESDDASSGPGQEKGLSELLDSDKIKYEMTLALQKLGREGEPFLKIHPPGDKTIWTDGWFVNGGQISGAHNRINTLSE